MIGCNLSVIDHINNSTAAKTTCRFGGIAVGRFIFVAFLFMGWAFYELSGGSDFDPDETRNARLESPENIVATKLETKPPVQQEPQAEVSRVSLDLASLNDVLTPAQQGLVGLRAARQTPQAEVIEASVEPEQEVRIILPSLVEGADAGTATVTPVDFSDQEVSSGVSASQDIRRVTGNRVNVRGGPGTSFNVVNKLARGDEVEILEDPGNGWVMLRPKSGGPVGWMADFLLEGS
jgi:hypothetical protein